MILTDVSWKDVWDIQMFGGEKRTNKQKTHKHFSGGPCGTIVPGTIPHPSQGQTGQNGDLTVELNRKGRFVPGTGPSLSRGGVPFVPGMVPICHRHRPAQNVYVYLFFSCPRYFENSFFWECKNWPGPVEMGFRRGTFERQVCLFRGLQKSYTSEEKTSCKTPIFISKKEGPV